MVYPCPFAGCRNGGWARTRAPAVTGVSGAQARWFGAGLVRTALLFYALPDDRQRRCPRMRRGSWRNGTGRAWWRLLTRKSSAQIRIPVRLGHEDALRILQHCRLSSVPGDDQDRLGRVSQAVALPVCPEGSPAGGPEEHEVRRWALGGRIGAADRSAERWPGMAKSGPGLVTGSGPC